MIPVTNPLGVAGSTSIWRLRVRFYAVMWYLAGPESAIYVTYLS